MRVRVLAAVIVLQTAVAATGAVVHDDPERATRVAIAGDEPVFEAPEPDPTTSTTAEPDPAPATTPATAPAAPLPKTRTPSLPKPGKLVPPTQLPWAVPTCPAPPAPFTPAEKGVYTVPTAGGAGAMIIPYAAEEPQAISYSPDGARIAYTRFPNDGRRPLVITMHIANADGTGEQEIDHRVYGPLNVSWSPDGRYLAYTSQVEGEQAWATYLYNVATGVVTERFRHVSDANYRWSRDGKQLAWFASYSGGLWVAAVEGSAPRRIADDVVWSVDWSPDNSKLAFGKPNVGGAYIVNPDGSDRRLLDAKAMTVSWSPVDANVVAVDRGGMIYLVDLTANTSVYLVGHHLQGWLRGGSKIVATDIDGILLVTPAGCVHTLVPYEGRFIGLRDWSPDDSTVIFAKINDGP